MELAVSEIYFIINKIDQQPVQLFKMIRLHINKIQTGDIKWNGPGCHFTHQKGRIRSECPAVNRNEWLFWSGTGGGFGPELVVDLPQNLHGRSQ